MDMIPILVLSCDNYSDLWEPFFKIFFNRWPDCPCPVFLATNHIKFQHPRVSTICVGDDQSWATGFLAALNSITSERFILFLEDFFLLESVDTHLILRLATIAAEHDVGCLRLAAGLPLAYPPSGPVQGLLGIGIINKGEPYRVSAQVAIWKKETIRKLALPGMNAWEFEEIGSAISKTLNDLFWAVYEPTVNYVQCVEKGKWKPQGLEMCRAFGIAPDLIRRPSFSEHELARYLFDIANESTSRQERINIIDKFLRKQTMDGIRDTFSVIKAEPFDIKLWLILVIGAICPVLFNTYYTLRLRSKIKEILKRHAGRLIQHV